MGQEDGHYRKKIKGTREVDRSRVSRKSWVEYR